MLLKKNADCLSRQVSKGLLALIQRSRAVYRAIGQINFSANELKTPSGDFFRFCRSNDREEKTIDMRSTACVISS